MWSKIKIVMSAIFNELIPFFKQFLTEYGAVVLQIAGTAVMALASSKLSSEQKREIDKNLLLVDGSIRNALLCVKNILAQDVGCGTSDCAEGTFRHSSFKEKFSPFSRVTCRTGISPGIQTDLAVTSCFQMRHDVRIECNRRMNIQDRRNSRLVDVEYVRRNRRFWIRIM